MKKYLLATLTFSALMACGTTPSGSITSVGIETTKVVLKETQSSLLTANITGTGAFNNALTWAIEGGAVGTLSSTTGSSVTYTAPSSTFGRVVRVTATSVQDSSKKQTIYLGVHPNKPSMAAGYEHTLAIKSDSSLLTWGDDFYGQLGEGGTNTEQATPVPVTLGVATIRLP